MKNLILLFAMALLPIAGIAQSNTYNESDKAALRAFLSQPSADGELSNGGQLGLTTEDMETWEEDEDWVEKVEGLDWNYGLFRCIYSITWEGKSLAGNLNLSGCTDLRTLYCSRNQLATLDVSANTALDYLSCTNNELTTLDVSKNTALKILYCGNPVPYLNCNQLADLDVSKNTALEGLDCSNNELTTLDISVNTALRHLYCENNELTTLDVSKNTALTYLHCQDNPLTTLDVSANTALTSLFCSNNALTILDVSKNTALEWLVCRNNELTTLDVSKNTVLEVLDCNNNPLTTLDVRANTALTNLDCSNNELTTLDVSKNTALVVLECNNNELITLDVSKNTALTNLDCSNNELTTLDVSKNTALWRLLCSNNALITLDVSKNTALEWLDCSNNELTTLDISKNTTLTSLNCSNNPLTDVTVGWTTLPARSYLSVPADVSSATLHVPAGTKAFYQAADVWKDFGTIVEYGASLTVNSSTLDFEATGGTQDITVTTNATWTAVSSKSWATVSPASGVNDATVSVTVTTNTGSSERTATITITGGGITRTVDVTQAAAETPPPAAILNVSPSSLDFPANGGSQDISVTSNTSWTASSSELWATVSPASGSNDDEVSVTVTTNTGSSERTATITITGGGITRTVDVTQAAAETPPPAATLEVSTYTRDFPAEGGLLYLFVTSNTSWTVSSSESWATVSPASGSNDETVRVTAAANDGGERTATITITGGGITRTVDVTQAEKEEPQVVVTPSEPAGNQGTIDVSLSFPEDEAITSFTFDLTLPDGFHLNREATALDAKLVVDYQLTITEKTGNSWSFDISPKALRSASSEPVYQKLVDIAYTVDESVESSDYEITISNLLFEGEDGTVIEEDEIIATVTTGSPVGILSPRQAAVSVYYSHGVLTVYTPKAEQIDIYSFSGARLFTAKKPAGEASYRIWTIQEKTLIVRGSSGWVKKIAE